MKTEWRFNFETRGFHFEKEHKFRGTFTEPLDIGNSSIEGLEFSVRVTPENRPRRPGVEQAGALFVTVPFDPKVGRDLAHSIAARMADRIAFQYGDFQVFGGLLMYRKIGETPEEIAAIGDKPCSIEFTIEEVIATPAFDSADFASVSVPGSVAPLLAEFNEAFRDTNPIRQFLGFFRVLESISYAQPGSRGRILREVLAEGPVGHYYRELVPNGDVTAFVREIVQLRHQCAHLKHESGFGLLPGDAAQVRPYLATLEAVARRCLTENNSGSNALAT